MDASFTLRQWDMDGIDGLAVCLDHGLVQLIRLSVTEGTYGRDLWYGFLPVCLCCPRLPSPPASAAPSVAPRHLVLEF